MAKRALALLAALLIPTLLAGAPPGDEDRDVPLSNWSAAQYWSPIPATSADASAAESDRSVAALAPPPPLQFHAVTPCRIVNTRRASTGDFDAPALIALTERTFILSNGPCPGLPANAGAWSLNITVVPAGIATIGGYLTVWPAGGARPVVSTLNFLGGASAPPVANAAIVPAGPGGAITVFPSDTTHLLIDVNGYYALSSAGVSSVFGRTGTVTTQAGDYTALQVTSSPTGGLAATNVQAALGELETEKAVTYPSAQVWLSRTTLPSLSWLGIPENSKWRSVR